jgi:hypothetical protein
MQAYYNLKKYFEENNLEDWIFNNNYQSFIY